MQLTGWSAPAETAQTAGDAANVKSAAAPPAPAPGWNSALYIAACGAASKYMPRSAAARLPAGLAIPAKVNPSTAPRRRTKDEGHCTQFVFRPHSVAFR